MSSHVSVGCEPEPPRAPPEVFEPGMTMSRFEPIDANASSTLALAPSPMATEKMTAHTPMIMPSVVRNERILLRMSARKATRSVCRMLMAAPRSCGFLGRQLAHRRGGVLRRLPLIRHARARRA